MNCSDFDISSSEINGKSLDNFQFVSNNCLSTQLVYASFVLNLIITSISSVYGLLSFILCFRTLGKRSITTHSVALSTIGITFLFFGCLSTALNSYVRYPLIGVSISFVQVAYSTLAYNWLTLTITIEHLKSWKIEVKELLEKTKKRLDIFNWIISVVTSILWSCCLLRYYDEIFSNWFLLAAYLWYFLVVCPIFGWIFFVLVRKLTSVLSTGEISDQARNVVRKLKLFSFFMGYFSLCMSSLGVMTLVWFSMTYKTSTMKNFYYVIYWMLAPSEAFFSLIISAFGHRQSLRSKLNRASSFTNDDSSSSKHQQLQIS